MNTKVKEKKLPTRLAAYLRFTKGEYKQLVEASRNTGLTIPKILKGHYFEKPIGRPLIGNDVAKSIGVELRRIGNNVNQIARQLNSGIYEGWHPEFATFSADFSRVYQLIASYSRK
jgi:hypothetical protein